MAIQNSPNFKHCHFHQHIGDYKNTGTSVDALEEKVHTATIACLYQDKVCFCFETPHVASNLGGPQNSFSGWKLGKMKLNLPLQVGKEPSKGGQQSEKATPGVNGPRDVLDSFGPCALIENAPGVLQS